MDTQWTNEEIEALKGDIAEKKPFSVIAEETGRTIGAIAGKAYRLRGGDWTDEEIKTLTLGFNNGDTFTVIAEGIPGRTVNACINKAKKLKLTRHRAAAPWTREETEKLIQLSKTIRSYDDLDGVIEHRTKTACRKQLSMLGIRSADLPNLQTQRKRPYSFSSTGEAGKTKEKRVPKFRAPASQEAIKATMAMDNNHCRYVWGDPDKDNFDACMKKLEDGERTYCTEHRNIMTGTNQAKGGGDASWAIMDGKSRPTREARMTKNGGYV